MIKQALLIGLACVPFFLLGAIPALASSSKAEAEAVAKLRQTGPRRISLLSGRSEVSEDVILKPGESRQFVFRGKTGQIFMVDSDSKEVEIRMVKGKDAVQMKEPGHYDSTLVANGDFVFQVKNTSKKELKSALSIILGNTGISNR